MPVIPRVRHTFKGQIRAHIHRVLKDTQRILKYNAAHPEKAMLTAGQVTDLIGVGTLMADLLNRVH
jgi:hypothetical protein